MKRTLWILLTVAMASMVCVQYSPAATQVKQAGKIELYPLKTMVPNGEYLVSVWKNGNWVEAGTLTYDRFMREKKMDLRRFITGSGQPRVRLVQKGGGAAHIDAIALGKRFPLEVTGLIEGMKKLSKKDNDIADAFNKTIEVVFPAGSGNKTLSLSARVENEVISKAAFIFPTPNSRQTMDKNSAFYTYHPGSGGMSKPFFKEYSPTGSGHPSGITYGWVHNDDKNLYVKIDFTPDNTMDGDKDYAAVYVNTPKGVKEFKVSVPEQAWGRPSFTYTDKVAYEHKVYDFTIPFTELDIAEPDNAKELKLAFSAYGTAAALGDQYPALAYDSANNRYLVVFPRGAGFVEIVGQWVSADGIKSDSSFFIANTFTDQATQQPAVAYDDVNHRFLVVWEVSTDIYAQLVNADSSLNGGNIVISTAANSQQHPSVAYDSVNQRFLVAWEDGRSGINNDIYGQLVDASGALSGSEMLLSNADHSQSSPAVSFDSTNERFLVVWYDGRDIGSNDIYGQLVSTAGTTTSGNFVISNAPDNQNFPSVAFDNTNSRYLVAWHDLRNTTPAVYGQLVNADGTLYSTESGTNLLLSAASNNAQYPSLAFDSTNQRFLVAWQDLRVGDNSDIYGQLVNAAGTLASANFEIQNTANNLWGSEVAYNSASDNFMVAYFDTTTSTIYFALSETAPPTVLSTTPADNAANIALNTSITAVFSEAMDSTTLTADTFTLKDAAGNSVSGTVTYDAATRAAAFTPSANLAGSTVFRATITIGAKDSAGNALAAEKTWTFTTGTSTDAVPVSGSESGGKCFIATAAYGSYLDPHVRTLQDFRDRHLLTNGPGRVFVNAYYRYSPPLANLIGRHESLRFATRIALTPMVVAVSFPAAIGLSVFLAALIFIYHRRREFARLK